MKKIKVYIEIGLDGKFGAYEPELALPFGTIGEGTTAQEAREDFLGVVEAYRDEYPEAVANAQFEFHYDIRSFLEYYTHTFTLAGLSRITGIAAGQLSHYLNGVRNPSAKTMDRIQSSMRAFGEQLSHTSLL